MAPHVYSTKAPPGGGGARDVVEGHLPHPRLANRRPSTIYQRGRVLARVRKMCGVELWEATADDLWPWWSRDLAPESRACELAHARQFVKWARANGIMDDDPLERFERPSIPRRLPRPISTDDLVRAIQGAPDRVRPMLALAALAGLRASEIAQLRADHLFLSAHPPLLVVEVSKGGGMSSVPISEQLAHELRRARLPKKGYLFRRMDGRPGPLVGHNISGMCNTYLADAGIDATLHQLRHWFGTETYRATGRSIRATQELLRHRSPVSTAIYSYVDPGDLADAVDQLPKLA